MSAETPSSGTFNASPESWNSDWQTAALNTPCGSCTGRACTVCSIRVGGPAKADGQPTGYASKVLEYYNPNDATAGQTAGTLSTDMTMQSAAQQQTAAAIMQANARMATFSLAAAPAQNAIVLENMKQGTPESVWLIDQSDQSIEGYAAQFTINHGQTVDFKINTNATNYRIDIYRLGYYGGDGARLVDSITKNLTAAQVQPDPLFDPATKLVDAGNWSVSASWNIPGDAVSGVYIAELTRLDDGGQNMIPFIVRDDNDPSAITFQTSDTTWQAYNWWGGYNLYGGVNGGGREGRADAVSYNRPIITRDGGFSAGPQDFIFGEEYPAIRWLEQNGYDVNYISGIDTARDASQLLNSQVFLSVGHDEYWSADQRANVEAARDAGVNLAFMSGNEVYWETRWANSIDGSGTPYKTLVSYKETWSNADTDPGSTTATWRDPQLGAGDPENALTGTMFTVDSYRLDTIKIPYDLSNFRFWSNTAVANIQPGQVYSLTPNLLGYEWDSDVDNGFRPAGLVDLSSTTVDVNSLLLDNGNTTGPGTSTHSLTLYRAPSGALVFGAGTVYWSWGLDSHHDNETTPTDPNVQQAMVNLFADMGVQPETLMASLVAATQSTDTSAPTSTITSPTASGSFTASQQILISGTATDAGGGSVATVEVSTDGGTTWHRATGFENWTYEWTPLAGGNYTIKSRAVDDSVNLEKPTAGTTITVGPAPITTFFAPTDTPAITSDSDIQFVNLGVKFSSSQSGSIIGIKFYKGVGDGGTHVASLWSSTGTLLAKATFTQETASGWQTVTFDQPVEISAGTTYIASYHSQGKYADTEGYFAAPVTRGPLTAQSGVFSYDTNPAFPSTGSNVNYWVDVIYSGVNVANQPPVAVNDSGFTVVQNTPITIAASVLLNNDSDPNGDILSISGIGAASGGIASFNAQNNTVTFTPNAGYTGPASFGYAITDNRGGTASAQVSLTVAPAGTNVSLFSSSDIPSVLSDSDNSQVNLGTRFVASANGTITRIRYYKGTGDTGTHTGSLWSSSGTLLATATFTNESASGWQTVSFSSPISITAGTSYVASFHSNGHYTDTSNYFTVDHVNGPLTALAGNNGVYAYGTGNLFPNNTYNATNYWVDVLYSSASGSVNHNPVAVSDSFTMSQNTTLTLAAATLLANDTDPDSDTLSITGAGVGNHGTAGYFSNTNTVTFTPTAGYTGPASFTYAISDGHGGTASGVVNITVNAAADQPPVAVNDSGFSTTQDTTLSITAATLLANDSDPDGDPLSITGINNSGNVNGSASFNAQTNTIVFTPIAGYTGPASFVYTVSDGRGGTANATVNLTVNAAAATVNLFSSSDTPAVLSDSDASQVNLGVRFVASANGTITGIKYYKGAGDSGTHTGTLWSSSGTLLTTATFTNETSSGWQTVTFSNPISITAGTTYVASFHSNGHYTDTSNYFATDHVNGSLTAPAGNNGVYAYGSGNLFPTSTYNNANYWVDVVFSPATAGVNHNPIAADNNGLSATQNTMLSIPASTLLANDSDPDGDPLTVTGASGAQHGTAAFNVQTNTVTYTPNAGYTGADSFNYAISDGRGGTATAAVGLTVNAASSNIVNLFSPTSTPSIVSVNDTNSVELGFKFQASNNGDITGIKFYKGAQNTGTHVADLWSATGTLLASATFSNETASGWQQVNFATPVTISAGTTYIASYHTAGHYSADPGLFATAQTNGPLTAPSSSSSGGNGVYAYGGSNLFPTNSYNSNSYGVDVLFRAQLAA
jgi:hypothetical protein